MKPIDADALREKFADVLNSTYTDDYAKGFVAGLYAALNMPTLTPPNEWVSVEETKPEPGERVIATDGAFVGEGYMDCYGVWCRPNGMRWDMLDSEVTHWMPISAPPDRRPPEGGTT